VVVLTHNARASLMSIDRRVAPGFGEYLLSQMERLFAEYEMHHAGSRARDHQPKPLERT
jgi:hypothetical protein